MASSPSNFTVLGDLNLHFDDPSDPVVTELIQNLLGIQMKQSVTSPTHEKGHLLDPIFSNWKELSVGDPVPVPWSDDFLVPFSRGC